MSVRQHGFLCALCGIFANFAVKEFGLCSEKDKILNRKVRKDTAKGAKETKSEIGAAGATDLLFARRFALL